VLQSLGIGLDHVDMTYAESHDLGLEEVARASAERLASELDREVVTEDTGLFFTAFDGFPGALPKFVFNTLGYVGIFKLLAGESREAYFKSVAAYAKPGQPARLFEGIMRGTITEEVQNKDADVMPYDRIFIPRGKAITISAMTLAEKNALSQRAAAFKKLGIYVSSITT